MTKVLQKKKFELGLAYSLRGLDHYGREQGYKPAVRVLEQ